MYRVRHFILAIPFLLVSTPGFSQATSECYLPTPPLSKTLDHDCPGGQGGVCEQFPLVDTVNVLVVFVQHLDDEFEQCIEMRGGVNTSTGAVRDTSVNYDTYCAMRSGDGWDLGDFQSWTDDQTTEWPADLSASETNQGLLPTWAEDLIDLPGSTSITAGSITDFYDRISNGQLTVTGHVWPYTYRSDTTRSWYKANKAPYDNGMLRLSREILEYVGDNPCGNPADPECTISWDDQVWDRYTNGSGETMQQDGVFDMIVLLHRFSDFPTLMGISGAGSITSLGYNTFDHEDGLDPTGGSPLYIGTMQVKDNFYEGSGVIGAAYTKKQALRILVHEIGHRQFGLYHTDDGTPGGAQRDYYSLMNGSAHLSPSPADRVKAGWANVQYEDINSFAKRSVTLEDMWESGSAADALWLMDGPVPACGDILIEARKRTFFTDKLPAAGISDGDAGDFHLPDEGLLVVKAPEGCSSVRDHSSMPNATLYDRWKYFGTTGSYESFGPGGAYTPQFAASTEYGFWTSSSLDPRIAITDIAEVGNGYSFDVHSDYQGMVIELEASADTYIDSFLPISNFGGGTTLRVSTPDPPGAGPVSSNEVRLTLLKWNLSPILGGSIVHAVRLRVDVDDETSPTGYGVFELKRPWSELQATWLEASLGQSWAGEGASGASDRGFTLLSPFSPRNKGAHEVSFNDAGVALVQNWINNSSTNNGIILAFSAINSNEAQFQSKNGSPASERPILEVTYVPSNVKQVDVNILLEGASNLTATEMTTTLNPPLTQPYNVSPWFYPGTESVSSVPADAVDWVLVHLLTDDTDPVIVERKAGLVDKNGDVSVQFTDAPSGQYRVAVDHRNHIGAMSAGTIDLTGATAAFDFSVLGAAESEAQRPPMKDKNGVQLMFAADGRDLSQVTAPDFNLWLRDTKAVLTGYVQSDYNMNSQVTATDFNLWLVNTKAVATMPGKTRCSLYPAECPGAGAALLASSEAYVRLKVAKDTGHDFWVDVEIRRDPSVTDSTLGSADVDMYYDGTKLSHFFSFWGDLGGLNHETRISSDNGGTFVRFEVIDFGGSPAYTAISTDWQLLVQHQFTRTPPPKPENISVRLRSLHLGVFENIAAGDIRSLSVEIESSASKSGLSEAAEPEIPLEFSVGQNYPNPFNPVTQVSFSVPEKTPVRLSVFDMLGRTVRVELDDEMPAGVHVTTIDASELPSGIYFYTIEAGQFRETRKMTVLR